MSPCILDSERHPQDPRSWSKALAIAQEIPVGKCLATNQQHR